MVQFTPKDGALELILGEDLSATDAARFCALATRLSLGMTDEGADVVLSEDALLPSRAEWLEFYDFAPTG